MNPSIQKFLMSEFLGNSGRSYTEAFVILLISTVGIWIFKKIILMQLKRIAQRTQTDIDDYAIAILEQLSWPFYITISVYFASKYVYLAPGIIRGLDYFILCFIAYYIIKSATLIIDVGTKKYITKVQTTEQNHDPSVIQLMGMLLKAIVWAIAIVFLLSNFGINISALVAGLGIGGIAVAFALQNVLSDIFSSFSIYFDKPFRVGDTIQVGTDSGKVKKIGIKSTRIETTQGQELVISNKELTAVRINNFKRMERRRQMFTIGVTYDTPIQKIEKIPQIIKDIITKTPETEIDYVAFTKLDVSALTFEVAYYIKKPDIELLRKAQQNINIEIMKKFQKDKIKFAYPTQTIYVNK